MLPPAEDDIHSSGSKQLKFALDPLRKEYDHSKFLAGSPNIFDDK
jgi:hypothetical protein